MRQGDFFRSATGWRFATCFVDAFMDRCVTFTDLTQNMLQVTDLNDPTGQVASFTAASTVLSIQISDTNTASGYQFASPVYSNDGSPPDNAAQISLTRTPDTPAGPGIPA